MAARRRFMGRAPRRRRSSIFRRAGRRASRAHGRAQAAGRRLGSAFPSWAKPSRVAAYTGVAAAVGTLVFTPIPNGSGGNDSWLQRVLAGYGVYKQTQDPTALLAQDEQGNNAATIAVAQLKQNAVPAIGTLVGFGIGAALLKHFGM